MAPPSVHPLSLSSLVVVGALDEAGPAVLPGAADADGDVDAAADVTRGRDSFSITNATLLLQRCDCRVELITFTSQSGKTIALGNR